MPRTVEAVPETVIRLSVNAVPVATWTCSPGGLESLAVGRLLALGFLDSVAELGGVRVTDAGDIARVDAEIDPERAAAGFDERTHRLERGCGLRHLLDCAPGGVGRADPPAPPPSAGSCGELLRELFARSPSRASAGGHHSAALSDGLALMYTHEEVGRHNAVDRAIGQALLDGADRARLGALGLVTTARISGEIAEHAARARVGWIASRSVPTTLALEIASTGGLAIVARAAGADARVFSPDRL